ncbi:LPXTG cell wall anchor domain-containing protein [Streptococcus suis]|uniref:LPXTG cell wall anchor domain-containing protein n=1 Tax=Streptococcus suis TaxID=1307 RepID=A0A426TCQ9_STRSU|nr:LPXTG cell wall anchor domain-containing protein [Streptococcus suis]
MSNNTIKFSLRKTSIGLLSLAAIAVAGTATVSAAEVEVANVTAHGTGVTADPIPTFDLNTGELTAKGSSVLNSDYKPALDPSTVDIHVHGEGTTTEVPEVKLAFENGEPYVYATGTGVTASAELPALDPSTVDIQVNGEGVTAPALEEAKVALDENGLYLTNVPTEAPTAEVLPTVQIGGKDGDYYLYTNGEGTTAAELPTIDPSTIEGAIETAKGESVKAPVLPSIDPASLVAPAPAAVAPAPAAVTSAPAAVASEPAAVASESVAKTTSTTAATLPNTGQTNSLVYLLPALGLLGAAAVVAKKKEI